MTNKRKKRLRKKRLPALPLHKLPNQQSIVDQARSYGPACVRALADEAANNSGAPRVAAVKELLDRGFGKVGQPVALTGMDGGPVEVNLSANIANVLRAVNGETEE